MFDNNVQYNVYYYSPIFIKKTQKKSNWTLIITYNVYYYIWKLYVQSWTGTTSNHGWKTSRSSCMIINGIVGEEYVYLYESDMIQARNSLSRYFFAQTLVCTIL